MGFGTDSRGGTFLFGSKLIAVEWGGAIKILLPYHNKSAHYMGAFISAYT